MWWLWVLAGLALLAVELAMPGGFFALFFGLSAIVVGAIVGAGMANAPWLQWTLFSVLSVLALATLRGPLRGRLNLKTPGHAVDSLVGQAVIALDDLAAGGMGKVELRGSPWSARNHSAAAVGRGRRCIIDEVDGLTLVIRPD